MSGVRAGRWWGGGEVGEDGRCVCVCWGGEAEERKRDGERENWGKREGEWRTSEKKKKIERSGVFPRTVGPRRGVGCPSLISARSGSGFSSNPVLRKQSERGGWVKREIFVFFFFFVWS